MSEVDVTESYVVGLVTDESQICLTLAAALTMGHPLFELARFTRWDLITSNPDVEAPQTSSQAPRLVGSLQVCGPTDDAL